MEVGCNATNGGVHHQRRHLAAIPFPGRGHINPMLSLCDRLASRGLAITFIVTEEWLGLLSSAPKHGNVRLRSIPNVLPSEKTRGRSYGEFLMAVLTKMEGPVDEAVGRAGGVRPVDGVLADSMLPWAPGIGRKRGIPVSSLFTQSATMFLALQQLSVLEANHAHSLPQLIPADEEASGHLKYLPRFSAAQGAELAATFPGQNAVKTFTKVISWFPSAHSLLFTSPYALESQAVDTIKSQLSLPSIYSIGPSILNVGPNDAASSFPHSDWLDARPPGSVLYVSLGSFLPISRTQMDEITAGLHESRVRFLLAARDADEATRIQEASGGGGLGLVVPWAEQLQTLCHPSVGGFLTHCGWNSTLEGVYAGVPMLVFPLMWDQFPNSKLIVDEWRVGLRLKNDGEEGGDGVVGREEIARVVKKLMDLDCEEGKEMRGRMGELREECRAALGEEGSSSECIDAFVRSIGVCGHGNKKGLSVKI